MQRGREGGREARREKKAFIIGFAHGVGTTWIFKKKLPQSILFPTLISIKQRCSLGSTAVLGQVIVMGSILCIVGRSATSLVSTHLMPGAAPSPSQV